VIFGQDRAIEQFAEQDRIGGDDPGIVERVACGPPHAQAQFQPPPPGDQLPEMLGLDAKQAAGQFIGRGKAAFDQIGAELRERVERDVFDFVLQQSGNLMAVEPRVFADGLDRARPLPRVGHVPDHLRQPKRIPHVRLHIAAGRAACRRKSPAASSQGLTDVETALAFRPPAPVAKTQFPLDGRNRALTGTQTLLAL